MTLITICIPTYNRFDYLKECLQFLKNEIDLYPSVLNDIEFLISDNCSTDGTDVFLHKFSQSNPQFKFKRNVTNLGLVGNLISCIDAVDTEYIWFVSDDDKLERGSVSQVLSAIKENYKPEFVFLNYYIKGKPGYTLNSGYFPNSKDAALEIFNEGYGSLVFITSCVYKTTNLRSLSDNLMFTWLGGPLLFSFHSLSKGSSFIFSKPLVYFNSSNASYSGLKRELKLKFENYIPILEYLPQIGYDQEKINKTIRSFINKQSPSLILYLFFFPSKIFYLFKYISIKTLISLPIKTVSYLANRRK